MNNMKSCQHPFEEIVQLLRDNSHNIWNCYYPTVYGGCYPSGYIRNHDHIHKIVIGNNHTSLAITTEYLSKYIDRGYYISKGTKYYTHLSKVWINVDIGYGNMEELLAELIHIGLVNDTLNIKG